MKQYRNILSGLFVLMLCFACSTATERSNEVVQDRIHQSYSATYDGRTNTTSAFAQYRFGDGTGTTLELVSPSHVTHNHFSLSRNGLFGTSYEGNGTGFIRDAVFVYTDTNGETYVNGANIVAIAFLNPPTLISRTQGTTIAWQGGPLAPGEVVSVDFVPTQSGMPGGGNIIISTAGATSVLLDPSVFANSSPGTYQMCLTRSRGAALQRATSAGGVFNVRFTTAYQSFTLIN